MIAKRLLITVLLIVVCSLALILLATVFIEGAIWLSGLLGLHHALGSDTQTSENYATASGYGPMIVTALGFAGVLVTAFKHFNCHVNSPFCFRFGHPVPGTSFRACHVHHGERDGDGKVTADHIARASNPLGVTLESNEPVRPKRTGRAPSE